MLDTRHKIAATVADIPAAARRKLIIGHFDPLTAQHVRRIAELRREGEQLIVAITEPPDPLLPARARAELMAAMRGVDYVIIWVDNSRLDQMQALAPDETVHEETADLGRRRALAHQVVCRQNCSA